MQYRGSCHCGKVKIEFQGEFGAAIPRFSICRNAAACLVARGFGDLTGETA